MMITRKTNPQPQRGGFTLIELLAVILVIAILIALLVPVAGGAIRRTRETGVKNEISQLESAIANFKNIHGVEPPSSIALYEAASGWTGDATSTAAIRQIWPQFDFAAHDINGNGTTTDTIVLTGSECLVFFLGGMNGNVVGTSSNPCTSTTVNNNPSNGATTYIGGSVGFSKNPSSPFDRGGAREAPLFEFNIARFTDIDSDGFPEYKDAIPSQQSPYLYYSSYDGQGYNSGEMANGSNPFSNTNYGLVWPYQQGINTTSDPFWKPNSYQIISPGYDGISTPLSQGGGYGYGGAYIPSSTTILPLLASPLTTPVGYATLRNQEADNITNFSQGRLQP